jgi:hypothetical protein
VFLQSALSTPKIFVRNIPTKSHFIFRNHYFNIFTSYRKNPPNVFSNFFVKRSKIFYLAKKCLLCEGREWTPQHLDTLTTLLISARNQNRHHVIRACHIPLTIPLIKSHPSITLNHTTSQELYTINRRNVTASYNLTQ